jgi:hypothetical protein
VVHYNQKFRTTEQAAAEDRLAELERQKDEIMKSYSAVALLDEVQSKCSEQLQLQFVPSNANQCLMLAM